MRSEIYSLIPYIWDDTLSAPVCALGHLSQGERQGLVHETTIYFFAR